MEHSQSGNVTEVPTSSAPFAASHSLPWWYHPGVVILFNLAVFALLRLCWGGSNYLPSKVWYALCLIIPGSVAGAVATGVLCVPMRLDWPTAFHIAAALLYMHFDLLVGQRLCGAKHFGSVNASGLFVSKLGLTPKLGDGGAPPLLRGIFEFNGALLHEMFWNLCICQNLMDWGWSPVMAIAAVPVASCAVHAVTSNTMEGVRCAPQFCWVALAYHASGSVLPCGFIHAMWYMTDGKLLVNLATFKRDWDYDQRAAERMTPPPDKAFLFGWICILAYYGGLNALTHWYPWLRSVDPHVSSCSSWNPAEWVTLAGFCVQIIGGLATWGVVRAAMDLLAETGDLTTNGLVRCEQATAAYMNSESLFEEDETLPAFGVKFESLEESHCSSESGGSGSETDSHSKYL